MSPMPMPMPPCLLPPPCRARASCRARSALGALVLLAAGLDAQAQHAELQATAAEPTRPALHTATVNGLPPESLYLLPSRGRGFTLPDAAPVTERDARDDAIEADTAQRPRLAAAASTLARASLVQMPADSTVPGRYSRPKYALGFRSNTMKSVASGIGLSPETCLAPLIRARATLSQDGEASGRVMVFARCSLH